MMLLKPVRSCITYHIIYRFQTQINTLGALVTYLGLQDSVWNQLMDLVDDKKKEEYCQSYPVI